MAGRLRPVAGSSRHGRGAPSSALLTRFPPTAPAPLLPQRQVEAVQASKPKRTRRTPAAAAAAAAPADPPAETSGGGDAAAEAGNGSGGEEAGAKKRATRSRKSVKVSAEQ